VTWRPGRRTAIAVGVAGGVLGAGAIGAWLGLPSVVRDEAIARIERRTGLRCAIADVDLGFGEVVLRGVELHDDAGALEARLAEVTLDAGLVSLAGGGADAIGEITVRGGDVRFDASRAGAAATLDRLRGSQTAEDGSPPRRVEGTRARELRVVAVRASLADATGELLGARSCDLSVVGGVLEVAAGGVTVGSGSAESLSVESIRIVGSMAERQLERADARSVRVDVGEGSIDGAGVVHRARAVIAALRSQGPRGVAGVGGDRAPTGEPELDRARPVADRGGAIGSPSVTGPTVLVASAGAPAERDEGVLGLLAPEFAARIEGLSVWRRTPEGVREVLTGLEVAIERLDAESLRTRGHASPDGGGRLGWDLRIRPGALAAVGSIELDDVALAAVEPILPDGLPLHRPEDGSIDGELRIESAGDALHAVGRLAVRDVALASPRIAPQPVRNIALGLDFEATFRPIERRLEVARLRLESGGARLDIVGAAEWTAEHYLFEIDATLPPTPCSDALAAIPRDLLQEAAAFVLDGRIGGRLEARIDSRDLDATRLVIRVADGCRFEMVPPSADLSRFQMPFVHRVEEPDGTTFEMETGPGTASWTPIANISPFMLHAVIGHEDGGFFRHAGFSTHSIREALVRNLRAGRYVMGASTISMQLVKNVFLRREKTLARKVQEVLLTWWIESAWSKERILELYLNVIEYGPGVYGLANAARHYFGIEPADLSPAQAAYLASILPNPKLYHSHWQTGALGASWTARVGRFVRLLGERGRYDAVAVEEGLRELEAFRFHRPGEPPPPVRDLRGRAAPLPIDGQTGSVEAAWDEMLDGEVAEPGAAEYE
jgi:monofunctional biosynthetic peptidoglycan transglycosylase